MEGVQRAWLFLHRRTEMSHSPKRKQIGQNVCRVATISRKEACVCRHLLGLHLRAEARIKVSLVFSIYIYNSSIFPSVSPSLLTYQNG